MSDATPEVSATAESHGKATTSRDNPLSIKGRCGA